METGGGIVGVDDDGLAAAGAVLVQPAEKTMIAMTASTIGTEVGFIFNSASGSVDSSFGTDHDKRLELWLVVERMGGRTALNLIKQNPFRENGNDARREKTPRRVLRYAPTGILKR